MRMHRAILAMGSNLIKMSIQLDKYMNPATNPSGEGPVPGLKTLADIASKDPAYQLVRASLGLNQNGCTGKGPRF